MISVRLQCICLIRDYLITFGVCKLLVVSQTSDYLLLIYSALQYSTLRPVVSFLMDVLAVQNTSTILIVGLQHDVILSAQPYGLPLNETIFPQFLKRFGYATHIVGKVS